MVVDAESKSEVTLLTHNRIEEGAPGFLPLAPTEHPIEAVFMLLAPAQGTAADLRLLTKAIQLFQNLNVRRNLFTASSPLEVFQIIADNEVP